MKLLDTSNKDPSLVYKEFNNYGSKVMVFVETKKGCEGCDTAPDQSNKAVILPNVSLIAILKCIFSLSVSSCWIRATRIPLWCTRSSTTTAPR
jgi:hypothetical protein